jgi:hypothetical protein
MSNNDLTILPVRVNLEDEKPLKHPVHPNLPQFPFVLGIVAPKKSGKGVLVSNLLLNKNFWNRDNYDYCLYCSPTIYSDTTASHIRDAFPSTIYNKYSDGLIKDLIKHQETYPTKKEKPRVIFVADDCADFSNSRNKLATLSTLSRHHSINLIYMVQQCKSLNKVIRSNLSNVIIFKVNSSKELQDIYEEWGSLVASRRRWSRLYKYATNEKYSFIHLDLDSNPIRIFKRFNEEITNKFPESQDEIIDQSMVEPDITTNNDMPNN